jgi:hypothetical protein
MASKTSNPAGCMFRYTIVYHCLLSHTAHTTLQYSVQHCLMVGKSVVHFSDLWPVFLPEVFRIFVYTLKTSDGKVSEAVDDYLIPHSFQFIIHYYHHS